jgi:hypothetical protein
VWVGEGNDNPATLDMAQVNQAITRGEVVVSQGAFVTIHAEHPTDAQVRFRPGELAPMQGQNEIKLHVQVQAASWLPTSKLQVLEKDVVVFEQELDVLATNAMRFDQTITLALSAPGTDSFFLARVETQAGGPVLPNPSPSFTNPIYADGDGDQLYKPITTE